MEVPDNGVMELMPARGKVHFGAIDCIRLEIEESFDTLHTGR